MEYKIFTKRNLKLEQEFNVIIEYKEKDEQYNDFLNYIKKYNKKTKIIVKKDNRDIIINKEDIIYYFSDKKYNYCKTKEDSYRIKSKLYEIEKNNPEYLRISKCNIINTNKIRNFDMNISGKIIIVMEDGSRLQVSRRKICEIKDFLDKLSI